MILTEHRNGFSAPAEFVQRSAHLDERIRAVSQTLEIRIESLASDGAGLGHDASGRVVFVADSAPGDWLRVQVNEESARFLRATVCEILEPSSQRVKPRCRFFGRCGGCDWQHISYTAQCEAKRRKVVDAFERVGKLRLPDSIEMTTSPQAYAYRARTRLVVGKEGLAYRLRGSNRLCFVDECPILHPALERTLHNFVNNGSEKKKLAMEQGEIELACGAAGEARVVELATQRVLQGPQRIALDVGVAKVEISAGGFFQGNALLWSALLDAVTVALGHGARMIEFFAGAGFFTLAAARAFDALIAVESDSRAIADLHRNLRQAGFANVTPIASAVEAIDTFEAVYRFSPEVILLDPPRAGLSPRARKQVLALNAPRIVYLSCDPASLARDLVDFTKYGYTLKSVQIFDLFPQTAHVETLVRLEKLQCR